jgi:ATP-dependent protease ClpP protease subunit
MMIQAQAISKKSLTFLISSQVIYRKMLWSVFYLVLVGHLFSLTFAHADESTNLEKSRFVIEGTRLIFNGDVTREDGYDGIEYADAKELRQLLRENPGITLMELNSEGGVTGASLEMAAAVIDYAVDTVVIDTCESACTLVFMSGKNRTLVQGARLGFHSASWARDNMKQYYEETRETSGWLDEFAFASWAYEEGMRDMNKELELMASQGIDIQFMIRIAYVNFSDMWYPTRDELMRFGVIHLVE